MMITIVITEINKKGIVNGIKCKRFSRRSSQRGKDSGGNFRDFIERAYYSSDKRFPEETERKWVKVRGFNVKA